LVVCFATGTNGTKRNETQKPTTTQLPSQPFAAFFFQQINGAQPFIASHQLEFSPTTPTSLPQLSWRVAPSDDVQIFFRQIF